MPLASSTGLLVTASPRIVSAFGTSEGVHELLSAIVTEQARNAGKQFIFVDAQLLGMTPHMFFRVLHGNRTDLSDLKPDPDQFQALNNAVVLIDHAEELLTLKRFKASRHIWTFFHELVKRWDVTMFLLWQTMALMPPELDDGENLDLEPIGIEECKRYTGYHGYEISDFAAARFLETSNGYLEYCEAFNQQYRSIDTWDDRSVGIFRDHLARMCRDVCRHRWDRALLLARGYSSLKAVMVALARLGNRRLTDIAREIGCSVQATKEYLNELLPIGMIMHTSRSYRLKDPVFETWIRTIDADSGRPLMINRPTVRFFDREESFLEID